MPYVLLISYNSRSPQNGSYKFAALNTPDIRFHSATIISTKTYANINDSKDLTYYHCCLIKYNHIRSNLSFENEYNQRVCIYNNICFVSGTSWCFKIPELSIEAIMMHLYKGIYREIDVTKKLHFSEYEIMQAPEVDLRGHSNAEVYCIALYIRDQPTLDVVTINNVRYGLYKQSQLSKQVLALHHIVYQFKQYEMLYPRESLLERSMWDISISAEPSFKAIFAACAVQKITPSFLPINASTAIEVKFADDEVVSFMLEDFIDMFDRDTVEHEELFKKVKHLLSSDIDKCKISIEALRALAKA